MKKITQIKDRTKKFVTEHRDEIEVVVYFGSVIALVASAAVAVKKVSDMTPNEDAMNASYEKFKAEKRAPETTVLAHEYTLESGSRLIIPADTLRTLITD